MFTTKLIIYHSFYASHSLESREEPHFHQWKLALTFIGSPVSGKTIDFSKLEAIVKNALKPAADCFLNTSEFFSQQVRDFPTCETLGKDLFSILSDQVVKPLQISNSSFDLLSVSVTLCEGDQVFGTAIIERE